MEALARADLDEVLHLWSGLGYYARARNLQTIVHISVLSVIPTPLFFDPALPWLGLPRFRGQVNAFGHLMTFVSTVVGVGAVGHARSAWSKGLVGARRASTGPAASTPGAAA